MPDGTTKADEVPDPAQEAREALTAPDEAARLYRERMADARAGRLETLDAAASLAYVLVFRCEALS
ncbi:hypothetical protein ACFVT6_06135 [Streptomyces sp. NPDC058049]|uniref:hypothetical protein n=1 Tax=Streptomyces sp. NPDC058049 TaxID=3346314 RepID=UPI0036EDBD3E